MKPWVLRLFVGAAFAVLVVANLGAIMRQASTPAPPPMSDRPAILDAVTVEASSKEDGSTGLVLGPCWRREHHGQHVLYLEGDPFTQGYCNGRLTRALMTKQEQTLHDTLDELLRFKWLQRVVVRSLEFVYRKVPRVLSVSIRQEIAGFAAGYGGQGFAYMGPTYARIAMFHALHDISQAMVDNPLVACSAFGASGPATANGHTLIGRVFDFEGGRVFDEDKVVLFSRPDYGIPFVSVLWGGMAGAVSGMNAEGLGVVLNAAASDDFDTEGTPSTILVRRMLQYAGSIEDAVAMAESTDVFVTDILLVADGKTGDLAVIELSPGRVAVRRGEDAIYATNHLLTDAFSNDSQNASRMLDGTTLSRYERVAERVETAYGTLDPAEAVAILRDRKLSGDRSVALGHRGTIDALICAHAVVMDLTARKLWVSSAPHTLGAFVAYSLDDVFAGRLTDRGSIPADPMLADGSWRRFERARRLAGSDRLDDIRGALRLAPGFLPALFKMAELCEESGDEACAREAYRDFLDGEPPHRKHRLLAEERLRELGDSE